MGLELTIGGMTCDGCKAAVERVVGRVPGVTRAAVSLAAKRLEVEGDPDPAAVRRAIEKAGYTVERSP
jgi:copper chaperone CopZ